MPNNYSYDITVCNDRMCRVVNITGMCIIFMQPHVQVCTLHVHTMQPRNHICAYCALWSTIKGLWACWRKRRGDDVIRNVRQVIRQRYRRRHINDIKLFRLTAPIKRDDWHVNNAWSDSAFTSHFTAKESSAIITPIVKLAAIYNCPIISSQLTTSLTHNTIHTW